jgi:hypothetical protein
VGVCAALLLENSVGGALLAAQRPAELLVYPEAFPQWVLVSPSWTLPLVWIFRALLAGALLGFHTQVCLIGLSLLGVPLLAAAQLLGPTVHNMHLLWFLVLLAVAPSEHEWSLDQVLRRRRYKKALLVPGAEDVRRVLRASQALLFARLLLACVYFFPGAWKLGANGLAWASPQRLVPLFHSKWYQFDFLPALRVDEYPLLLQAGGLGIMALELAFPWLVLSTRGRWIACLGGLTFHVFSAQLLGIRFMPLWLCYGILIDWPRVLDWLQDRSAQQRDRPTLTPRMAHMTLVSLVGVVLLTGAVVQGARGSMLSWPFACYPTFHRPIADTLPDVLFVISTKQGERSYPSPRQARLRSQAAWGRTWDLLGYYGTPVHAGRLAAYAREQLEKFALQDAHVTLYEINRSTRPAQWDSAPTVIQRLGSVQF